MTKYKTTSIETERTLIKKGNSDSCKKIYEYDLTKCTGIDGQNELIKFDKPIDFIELMQILIIRIVKLKNYLIGIFI